MTHEREPLDHEQALLAHFRAHGSGAGAMRYDTQRRLILSTTDHSLMDMELDMPEGLIRVQVMNQQKQVARLATAP